MLLNVTKYRTNFTGAGLFKLGHLYDAKFGDHVGVSICDMDSISKYVVIFT